VLSVTTGYMALISCLSFSIFLFPFNRVIVPIVVATCFMPADIAVILGPFHLYPIRILAFLSVVKLVVSGPNAAVRITKIDKLFIFYNLAGAVIYVIASKDSGQALIFQSGQLVDSLMIYYVFRKVITGTSSIMGICAVFKVCVIILLPFVIFEFFTANNLFSFLGRSGISVRAGEIRAAATFSHPILLGSFGAALLPMLWALYKVDRNKSTLFSVLICVFFVFSCNSSGPIVALISSVFFLAFFRWRRYGNILFYLMLFVSTIIHFVRESPIWHFIYVRVRIKPSSTGYHRYLLFDAAVKEIKEWWLLGYGDQGPQWHIKYWPWTHATFTDVTNHYLLIGVRGGLLALLPFIILCYNAIKYLALASIGASSDNDQWLWWGNAVTMIVHCISFLSVAYFGQITMFLYITIAISSLAMQIAHEKK